METKDRSVSTRTRFSSRFLADPFRTTTKQPARRSFDLYLPCGLRRNFMKARSAPLSLTKFIKAIDFLPSFLLESNLFAIFDHFIPMKIKSYKNLRIFLIN